MAVEITGAKRKYEKPVQPKLRPEPPRPPEFSNSFSSLGVIAQPQRLIEVRAPNPDEDKGAWDRIYLTPGAADALLDWLPKAMETQDAEAGGE